MKTVHLFLGGIGLQEIIALIIMVLIFLAIRTFLLWYWKIDIIVANQQKQIDLLTELIKQKSGIAENKPYSNDELVEKAKRYDQMNK